MTSGGSGSSRGGNAANWAAVVAVVVSIFNIFLTTWSSQRDLALSGRGQIADRFSTTVELLSSEGSGKRLGAIYALEQIARDSPEYRSATKNALAGFVRVSSRELGPNCARAGLAESPDIAAAVSILADQVPEGIAPTGPGRWTNSAASFIDLAGACLHARNLERSRLDYARLSGADIAESAFDGASLRHARLGANGSEIMTNGSDYVAYLEGLSKGNVNIAGASFRAADLRSADLSSIWVRRSCGPRPSLWFNGARLTHAVMWQSAIPDAVFKGANMDGMKITASSFVGAEFDADTSMREIKIDKWANFEQANLGGVDLRGLIFENPLVGQPWPKINFRNANLRGADLRGLDLNDAEFSGADLREAKLDGVAQLSGARWDGWTLWPDNVKPTSAPAVVPSQPPPRKPGADANRTEAPMDAPNSNSGDQRVTVEASPDGSVRVDIAPPPASRPGFESSPSWSGTSEADPSTRDSRPYYDRSYSSPYPYSGYGYYYNNSYYSNYSGLNYSNNSEIFTAC
ncbi:pentapeptide repeat-containing protein [Mycolicibacterium vaccae]|uniref:pentapeptide repeat-containing protein n=1 Tax=Mycolicibacterium vaccae TaxID=1810 RepID=UPI003CFE2395